MALVRCVTEMGMGVDVHGLDHARVGTWWRVWGLRKAAMAPMLTGAWCWKEAAWAACVQGLAARPRRRT